MNAIRTKSRLPVGTSVRITKAGSGLIGELGEIAETDYSFGGGSDLYRIRCMVEVEGESRWVYGCFWRWEFEKQPPK
jgi:hypothetical protein